MFELPFLSPFFLGPFFLFLFGLWKAYQFKKKQKSWWKILGIIVLTSLPFLFLILIMLALVLPRNFFLRGEPRVANAANMKVIKGYRSVDGFSEGMALITKDKDIYQRAFIDKSGKKVISGEYQYISSFSDGLAIVEEFDRNVRKYLFGYIDTKGQIAIDYQFENAKPFTQDLAAVKIQNQYGYINKSGQMVISPQFDDAFEFFQDRAKVIIKGRAGFIDTSGQVIVEPKYYKADSFKEGLAVLCDRSKCGFIDLSGKETIPMTFDDAKSFSEGFAAVRKENKWLFINHKGEAIPGEFDEVKSFSEGLAVVGVIKTNFYNKKWGGYSGTRKAYGFIDTQGQYVMEPKFLGADSFNSGLAKVSIPQGDFFGEIEDDIFIDRHEQQKTSRFQSASSFKEGVALVEIASGKHGFINTEGKVVIKFESSLYWREGGLEKVFIKKSGFIDKTGQIKIEPQYSILNSFSNGLAYVGNRGRSYINQNNEKVFSIEPVMNGSFFSEGLAAIRVWDSKGNKNKVGFVDTKGQFVIPPQFYSAAAFKNKLAPVKFSKDSQTAWGYIDLTGKTVIEPKFNGAANFYNGLAFVQGLTPTGQGSGTIQEYFINEQGQVAIDLQKSGFMLEQRSFHLDPDSGLYDDKQMFRYYSFIQPLLPVRAIASPYKSGFVDMQGNFAIEPIYDQTKPFNEGLAPVRINSKWGYIDMKGQIIVEPQFDQAYLFFENRAMVEVNGKYGYIDPVGQWVIEPQLFEKAFSFSEGLALIQLNGKYGFIDTAGYFVVEPQYDYAEFFQESFAIAGFNRN